LQIICEFLELVNDFDLVKTTVAADVAMARLSVTRGRFSPVAKVLSVNQEIQKIAET
jgi:hypothetical protein